MPAIDRRAAVPRSLSPRRWWRCRPWTPGRRRRRDQRRAVRGQHGPDVVALALCFGPGPVPDQPPGWHAGPDGGVAGGVRDERGGEPLAAGRPQAATEGHRPHALDDGGRCGGVALVVWAGGDVELWLVAVETGGRVIRAGANAVTAVGPPRRSRGRFVAVLWRWRAAAAPPAGRRRGSAAPRPQWCRRDRRVRRAVSRPRLFPSGVVDRRVVGPNVFGVVRGA